jgi:hypothetical protein
MHKKNNKYFNPFTIGYTTLDETQKKNIDRETMP